MRHLTRTTRALALTLAATGLAGGAAAVSAAPAQAADVCHLHVNSLTSYDLNDSDGHDEIKIKLGDGAYLGPWNMPDDWTRNDSLGIVHKDFTGSVTWGCTSRTSTRQTIDVDNVTCTILGDRTLELDGNGAIYRMNVTVSLR